jgi:chorismate mutase/prephenate dehydratase
VADLGDLRSSIDRIDRELVRLLAERAEVSVTIGARKRESGEAALDAARERDLIERLEREDRGSFPLTGLQAIFREVLSASRALQGGFRVGYLGQPGGFAHQAAVRRFGESSTLEPLPSPQHLLERIESERLEYGVFAMEGDPEDPAFDAFDLFLTAEVQIVAEFVDVAGYQAMGFTRAPRRLHAHPGALARCQRWTASLPAGVEVRPAPGSRRSWRRHGTCMSWRSPPRTRHTARAGSSCWARAGRSPAAATRRRFCSRWRTAPAACSKCCGGSPRARSMSDGSSPGRIAGVRASISSFSS